MASENGQYAGLLIDWGGVLTSNLFESFRAFCDAEGIQPELVAQVFRRDPACRELLIGLETGRLPEEQFEAQFAAIIGVDADRLIDRLFAGSRPETRMLDAVLHARQAGIRTGLVSNSWGTRRYDRSQLADLFDSVVISGEVGIRKPAPEIYELATNSVGLEASACVFVDDLPFNLEPAAKLGMAIVHHVSTDATIAELERLLGVQLA